jgi:4-amino-4-deoxy-L-arabinose transferase-like glycosyltransferase
VFGVRYALATPLWQNPDEPAHYAYAHQIATGGGVPVLKQGDYDQAYLERLMAAGFPPAMPVDTLRYEGHQPPLFYLAAATADAALGAQPVAVRVRALRLFSLALGAGVVVLAFAVGRRVFPRAAAMAVAVAALPALLPQHVAMAAAVNNDALSWLLSAAVLLLSLRLGQAPDRLGARRFALGLGVLMGAVLLTKTTAYLTLALPVLALLARGRSGWRVSRSELTGLALAYGVAAVLGALWFGRNLAVYGGFDFLGLVRHNAIVSGQPLPLGWGLPELRTLATTLFQSFWLQLGWMTVPAQPWVYGIVAAVSGALLAGLAAGVWRSRRGAAAPAVAGAAVLGAAIGLAVLQVGCYNLQFLQPQGRYLFVALVPLAVAAAAGLRTLVGERALPWTVAAWCGLLAGLNLHALAVLLPFLGPN